LFGGELGELGAKSVEVEPGDFLVELLGEDIDSDLVVVLPNGDLGKGLVGETVGHDEAGVSSGASKVDQSAFGKEEDCVASRECVFVDLGLDVLVADARERLQSRNVDLIVKVADVADNGQMAHLGQRTKTRTSFQRNASIF